MEEPAQAEVILPGTSDTYTELNVEVDQETEDIVNSESVTHSVWSRLQATSGAGALIFCWICCTKRQYNLTINCYGVILMFLVFNLYSTPFIDYTLKFKLECC